MIDEIVEEMYTLVKDMQEATKADIDDVKAAKHEELLERNTQKEEMIERIGDLKAILNQEIVSAMQAGEDVNVYREKVDNLENELKKLYKLNSELATIVLPVQQMYKEIVDDLTKQNGGSLFDVKA